MQNNVFFTLAMRKASGILGKKVRLMALLGKLGQKLSQVNWKEIKAADVQSRFFVLGRLLKAYMLGHYRHMPWKPLLLITAAVVYFINPIDFVPDWIPGVGLTDDFAILMYIYASLGQEIDRFLAWEQGILQEV